MIIKIVIIADDDSYGDNLNVCEIDRETVGLGWTWQ